MLEQKSFSMRIDDVFVITGRGTVVTGTIEKGVIKVGDEVEISAYSGAIKTVVTGINMFRKVIDEAHVGDNVGLLLRGIKKNDVKCGQYLSRS